MDSRILSEIEIVTPRLMNTVAEIEQKLSEKLYNAKVQLVGSVSKGTWLPESLDIDFYIITDYISVNITTIANLFPIGRIKQGQLSIWHAVVNDFSVDFVLIEPNTFKREDTVAHTGYFNAHLKPDQKSWVREMKAYFKTRGVYGAEIGGITGVAIERLVETCEGYSAMRKLAESTDFFLSDPIIADRNLLANMTSKRRLQLQKAAGAYLVNSEFTYSPMNCIRFALEAEMLYVKFNRVADSGIDFSAAMSSGEKVARMMKQEEPEAIIETDAYVDENLIIVMFSGSDWKLSEEKEVRMNKFLGNEKAFLNAHPDATSEGDELIALVPRKIVKPLVEFSERLKTEMTSRGYSSFT